MSVYVQAFSDRVHQLFLFVLVAIAQCTCPHPLSQPFHPHSDPPHRFCSNRAPTLPESPFGRPSPKSGVTRPQLSSAQNTPSPPRRPRRRPSNSADVENLDPDLINPSSRYPRSPTSPAAQSTPPSERRSFQGDHHRHRYMVHSGQQQHPRPSPKSQSSQSPGQHCSPSAARGSPRKPPAQRVPPVTRSPHHPNLQHLGAPTNAHYSPHYGSPANKPSVSRRKPPPPAASVDVAMSNHLSRTLTPESVSPVTPAQKDGIFENSPRSSICSIVQHGSHKSRTPSPSPSPRSGGLVKKIGSVLSAPFRSSTSRRGRPSLSLSFGVSAIQAQRLLLTCRIGCL